MSPLQLAYFRDKLLRWRADLVREVEAGTANVAEEVPHEGDSADQATAETERDFELLNRDRALQLIAKIDRAVARIASGTYGYCEETGEPIGLKRLEAEPTATLSIDAQERQERMRTGGRR